MKRRGFLKSLISLAAAPVVAKAEFPKGLIGVDKAVAGADVTAFGLAVPKVEGASIIYDGNLAKALWPGIAAFVLGNTV